MLSLFSLISESQGNCSPPTISLGEPEINGTEVTINGVALPGGNSCTITSITWSWGDGNITTSWFPASHIYSKYGTYHIVVIAHQSNGLNASASVTVTLLSPYYTPTCKSSPPVIQKGAKPGKGYPISIFYSPYRGVLPNKSTQILQPVPNGTLGLSLEFTMVR